MSRRISVVENILEANERIAAQNQLVLDDAGVLAVNLMASPGAGKTSLIERTLDELRHQLSIAVIDGDIATNIDADRAAAAGAQAVQINTGGECHLDAVMLQQALEQLELGSINLLIVENVGNLICPANFQLGTHLNILIASTPEGDDKPYKYPGMYRGVDALVINKVDLLPYIDFDMSYFQRGVEALNPGLTAFPMSCKTGEGVDGWLEWLRVQLAGVSGPH
ncbi:MAG: hydrogenase nickel incorporation protein HypB [Anaerolineae bacterium]|nr:MAG: hydrogenase nickel incorporation protein HypB [Anaerolineae bacterium]